METFLVKILATTLAFSQATVTPHAIKTEFSRDRDQQQVAELLQAGCTHMIDDFQLENINLDDLLDTAMDDPQALGDKNKEFRGVNFADLQTAYRQFCKHQPVEHPVVDLGACLDNRPTYSLH
jgi:penicillin-binding protein 1A